MHCCKCEEHEWDDPQEVIWEDPEDGKGYCLFHAPAEHKGMSEHDFNAQVSERIQAVVDLEDEKAWCVLRGTIFPGDICFAPNIELPAISLVDAVFWGIANFEGITFLGETYFTDSYFAQDVSFSGSRFEETVFYGGVRFAQEAQFRGVTYDKIAVFQGVGFGGMTYFDEAHFGGDVSFSSSTFSFSTSFMDVMFGGFVSFRDVSFDDCLDLLDVSFSGYVHFDNSQMTETVTIVNCAVSLASITFNETDPTYFDLTQQRDLANIHFNNSPWPTTNGRIKVCTEDDPKKLQATRDFYQRMKAKYKAENNEYEASKWHIAEKEAQLKLLKKDRDADFLYLMLLAYKGSSGFGENPARACVVLMALMVLPLLMWMFFNMSWTDFELPRVYSHLNNALDAWYTYMPLTRVTNDLHGWQRGLSIFWQLLIAIQAALFAFALRNNFRR